MFFEKKTFREFATLNVPLSPQKMFFAEINFLFLLITTAKKLSLQLFLFIFYGFPCSRPRNSGEWDELASDVISGITMFRS